VKGRCAGLALVLVSLAAFSVAHADIEFVGVLDPNSYVLVVDSVNLQTPDTTFFTPGWGSETPYDTFHFTGVTAWPEAVQVHGTESSFPFHREIVRPKPDTWYNLDLTTLPAKVKFYGTGYGVVESKPAVELPHLGVSPSLVTGQMTVRLQPAAASRPVVEICDAVGNVVRSLCCTAGSDGIATATWNREDESGRLVPEGVYFCRHASAEVISVRKVIVAR
jgi:hypothetical protein